MAFVRVSGKNRCPICNGPDWCGITEDGLVVRCMRITSDKECKGGWLHGLEKPLNMTRIKREKKVYLENVDKIAYSYLNQKSLEPLGVNLGVSTRALNRLCVGWDGTAWTFPMRDGYGKIIGVRRRMWNGAKYTLKNSRNGLFIPDQLVQEGPLLICEGPTDCAALIDMGYDVIGRPSCSTGIDMSNDYLKRFRLRDVVIVADNDEPKTIGGHVRRPGQEGAQACAHAIVKNTMRVCVIKPKSKDIRGWVQEGATRRSVDVLIRNATWIYN